jgi:dTDP-3-amino-3,4,6-trideoxy-alpha-D-glucose transaminase
MSARTTPFALPISAREGDLLVRAQAGILARRRNDVYVMCANLLKSMSDADTRAPWPRSVTSQATRQSPVTVPLLDVGAAYRELEGAIDAAAKRVFSSGRYVLGAEVDRFERAFAEHVGARHCIGVGNGLDALTLTLAALGVGHGDEVVVPAATFVATWLAVSHVGATPVPAAVDPATLTLDPAAVEGAITGRTRAIVPVHLYGHPADLEPIAAIARDHDLAVVDDAAQAHGAAYRGRTVGALTAATAFSFYPTKNLGAHGDAGAVTTDDDEVAARVRKLGNYGAPEKYRAELLGWNSRLDPLQAAILGVKLGWLGEWNARRRRVAARYAEALGSLDWLQLPHEASWATHVFHLFVVRTPRRDELAQRLAAQSIVTAVHYPVPPYRQPVYRDLPPPAGADHLDEIHGELLSLPMGPHLSDDQIDHVIAAVSSFECA